MHSAVIGGAVPPWSTGDHNVPHDAHRDPTDDWWRDAVVYQLYLRSFADGDGDGTGDISGIRTRLPYLQALGVDAIWVNPWYPSPLHDGGYDVADYRRIDPRFGTLEEAKAFIEEADALGIRVLVDLVPNHTSSEHAWFQAALAAGPGSPERERYHFRPGRGPNGTEPPTNWGSVFGGSAWERVDDGEWYLHLFDATQPDLNWEHPEVLDEYDDILRFWFDLGAQGVRVDVAHSLVKDTTFPDVAERAELLSSERTADHPYWDRDGVHEIIRRWRAVVDEYPGRMMVAEAWVRAERLPLYLRPDEYHQAFNFDILEAEWDAARYREVIETSIDAARAVGSTPTWVLSNHDVMRHTTRYGLPPGTNWRRWPLHGRPEDLDAERGLARARAATLVMLALPGAVYLYQGEELGLPEVWDLPADVLDDPVWRRSGHTEKGRDGCRVPLPWTEDGPSFGFGDAEPRLPQPASFGARSAAVQEADPSSTLQLYRTAVAARRRLLDTGGRVDLGASEGDVVVIDHESGWRCAVNMGDVAVPCPEGEVELASAPIVDGMLAADSAVWLAR